MGAAGGILYNGARSLGVARGSRTPQFAFGEELTGAKCCTWELSSCPCGGPERKPSEPDQDRRSIDLCGLLGRYACVGKRWIVWFRPANRFPQERFFYWHEEL